MTRNLYEIEQNHDKLLQITDFFFNLEDKDFIKYFISRTGICIDQVEKFEELKNQLMNFNHLQCKNLNHKPGQKGYCQESMVIRILRARLQDCWFIYQLNFI